MRERLIALRERRARLLERAAAEREQLGALVDRSDVLTRWMQAASRAVDEAKRHPAWLLAGVALLAALRPRRTLGWLMKGWALYRMFRRGRALLERFAPGLLATPRPS